MIGQTVSHYRILDKLGQGGMGVVYSAEDTHLGRRVAVKFAAGAAGPHFLARFLREARSASALNHPNIASIYDYGEDSEGQPFLVMELVDGQDLFQVLREKQLSVLRSVEIAAQIAEALREAHSQGILHRDIKPSNVLLNPRGQVKVLDFGLAKPIPPDGAAGFGEATVAAPATMDGAVVGTPAYMSPEQIRAEALGPESDLFALGAVLYECLARRPAFAGVNSAEILAAVLHVDPPAPSHWNPAVSSEIDRIVMKALAKDRSGRYGSAEDILVDLNAVASRLTRGDSQETLLVPAPKATVSWWRRARYLAAAGGVLCVVGVAAVYYRGQIERPAPEAIRWYQKGVDALRDGTYSTANRLLERAVEADENFHMAHARLAEAWSELHYDDNAKQEMLLANPVGQGPRLSREDREYLSAIGYTVAAKYSEAIDEYRQIVGRASGAQKANAEVDLGRAYERNEDSAEALAAYKKATELDPQNPAAWLRVGIQYSRRLNQANAEKAFELAESLYDLSNDEGVNEVRYQRAVLASRLNHLGQARKLLEDALATSIRIASVSQQILSLLQLSYIDCQEFKLEEAEARASKAIQLAQDNGIEPLTVNALIDLGNAYFRKSQYDQARSSEERALSYARRYNLERQRVRALLLLGNLEITTYDTASGVNHVREALNWYQQKGYQKETAQALTLLGRGLRQKGDYASAADSFNRQLKITQNSGDPYEIALGQQGIGTVLEAQGRWSEALRAYVDENQAAVKSSVGIEIEYSWLRRAAALWQLGYYADARQALSQVTSTNPQTSLVRAGMALSQRQFGIAVSEARKASGLKLGPYDLSEAYRIQALAQLGSGSVQSAIDTVRTAAKYASQSGDPYVIARSNVALAAIEVSHDPAHSLAHAQAAQKWFASAGNAEGEWHALLFEAEASTALGGNSTASSREFAQNAVNLLAGLGQKWDSSDYSTYLKRPDIVYERSKLSRWVNTK